MGSRRIDKGLGHERVCVSSGEMRESRRRPLNPLIALHTDPLAPSRLSHLATAHTHSLVSQALIDTPAPHLSRCSLAVLPLVACPVPVLEEKGRVLQPATGLEHTAVLFSSHYV